MTDVQGLLRDAAAAEARGRGAEALAKIGRALAAAGRSTQRFEVLLWQARAEERILGDLPRALKTYWDARHAAQATGGPVQVGEADLGIGMVLVEMSHDREGLEALRRAARAFRRAGHTFLRGCTEILLADEALREGDLVAADRGLEVAGDLLMAAGDPRMHSVALTLRAEVLARQGSEDRAEALLARAASVAAHVADTSKQGELRRARRAVREIIARALADRSTTLGTSPEG
jgi:tetratricopeptide (TPR) repeat protein